MIINYDASRQRTLGRMPLTEAGVSLTRLAGGWAAASRPAAVARRAQRHFTNFPVALLGGLIAFTAVLITLLNLRRLVSGLRDRSLRAHPERAPRESAALWYDRMVSRMARRGWRKSPSQTRPCKRRPELGSCLRSQQLWIRSSLHVVFQNPPFRRSISERARQAWASVYGLSKTCRLVSTSNLSTCLLECRFLNGRYEINGGVCDGDLRQPRRAHAAGPSGHTKVRRIRAGHAPDAPADYVTQTADQRRRFSSVIRTAVNAMSPPNQRTGKLVKCRCARRADRSRRDAAAPSTGEPRQRNAGFRKRHPSPKYAGGWRRS